MRWRARGVGRRAGRGRTLTDSSRRDRDVRRLPTCDADDSTDETRTKIITKMHTNKNDRNRTHTTIARLQSHFRSPTLLWSDYIQLLVRHAPARAHTDSKTRRHDKTPRTGHGHGNRNDGRYIESKHRRGGAPSRRSVGGTRRRSSVPPQPVHCNACDALPAHAHARVIASVQGQFSPRATPSLHDHSQGPPPLYPSCDLRTIFCTRFLYAAGSSRRSFAASMLAGDSSFGVDIIEMTETRMDSTVWMGSQRSAADS